MSLASTRWRVVVDTNVLVSGLLFGGKPEAILEIITIWSEPCK
jgi:predicted nucleic acid-binding protein